MNIVLKESNYGRIQSELDKVQARCTARTVSVADVVSAANYVESYFSGVSARAMNGVSVSIDVNAQHFPNAYRYIPESTIFCIVYRGGHWTFTGARRMQTRAPSQKYQATLTDAARAAIVDLYTTFY